MSLEILAHALGVSEASLAALGVKSAEPEWHFPERNAGGEIIGWQRRLPSGKKFMVTGSKRGLSMPWPFPDPAGIAEDDPLVIVEGGSDAAAGLDLGFTTIGRPSAVGGGELLRQVVKDRHVVIIGENDSGAGRIGAEKIATSLLGVVESVKVIYPPEAAKDLRAWKNAPAPITREELLMIIAQAAHWQPKSLNDPAPSRLEWRPFPVEVLPEPLRSFVAMGALAIGCDPAYLAMPALAVCAAAIGTSHVIEVKPGWTEPAILWCVSIGRSGSMKSPPMDVALVPMRQLERAAHAEHAAAMNTYSEELGKHKVALKEWERTGCTAGVPKPVEPAMPSCRRYTASDTTIEALTVLLATNPRGLLLARDELAGWVASFDQYRGSKGGDSAKWLEMHRANPLQVDRKTGEPRSVRVERAAVSICGTIQPGVMRRMMGREHFESGLVARMLLAYPPAVRKRWTDDVLPPELANAYNLVVTRLSALEPLASQDGELTPRSVQFTPRACSAFVAFFEEHAERQFSAEDDDLAAAFAKHENLPARLALIFHQVRVAAGEPRIDPTCVDEKSVRSAIVLTRWFCHETERVYRDLGESEMESSRRRLIEWVRLRGGVVTARELTRSLRQYPSTEAARNALQALVDEDFGDWVFDPPSPNGGPSTKRFKLAHSLTNDKTSANEFKNHGSVGVGSVSIDPRKVA